MNNVRTHGLRMAALLGVVALVATAGVQAEERQRFPTERSQPASCAEIEWNQEMLSRHPGLINACQEVVVAGGQNWARFAAQFVRVEPDGSVLFSVRDARDRSVEQVRMTPTAGQVAYINDRATPFRQLRSSDVVNLYVPEGQYGFATQPGVPEDQVATVAPARTEPAPAAQPTVAQRDLPAVLPRTASNLPWLALSGGLALLGALSLTLLRRRAVSSH
jgi:LPXTG-motif cell wall-anchored protein